MGDYTPTGQEWAQIAVSGTIWLVLPLVPGHRAPAAHRVQVGHTRPAPRGEGPSQPGPVAHGGDRTRLRVLVRVVVMTSASHPWPTRRRPRRRRAPPDHDHPQLARPRRGLGARRVRRHPGAVRRLGLRGRAALAQGLRPGLGHGRVRDAPRVDQHPLGPRVGQGPHRRPHPRDLPADRPLAARGHRLQGARREHHRPRLRRPPGRRRHPHRRDHRAPTSPSPTRSRTCGAPAP